MRTSGPISDCELGLENHAAAAVFKRAYDAGKLGTAAAIAKNFHGAKPSAYLNPDGTLRRLDQVTGDTRWDYEEWMASIDGDARSRVGDRMFAARMNTRRHSTCKSLVQ